MKGTVVVISSVHWHFTWQRHQNVASGLAERGYAVTFVEPLPKRWPGLRELGRILGRIFGRTRAAGMCGQRVPLGVRLVSPRLFPDRGGPARWINRAVFVPSIARGIRAGGLTPPLIVINYLPTTASIALQRALDPDLAVYDCAWDWSNDPYSKDLERIEERLVHEAALVLTDSPHNTERMTALHPRVVPIPHGVDYDAFAMDEAPSPADEVTCAYFGDLGVNIDLQLLAAVSHRYPLSLIGPVRSPLVGFSERTKVHGGVPHERLPGLLRDARVLLLPYRSAPHTRGVLPAKIFECLATGKPTVAIGLTSLERFHETIYLCRSAEEFVDTIAAAAQEDPLRREERRRLARRNTWAQRVAEIDELIQGCLG